MQALENVNVVSLGQIYNGPYCAMLLSYLGAEVVKVEPPDGEVIRSRQVDGEPPSAIMMNSSKRAVTIDLKRERGKELLLDLVEKADILVENYAVGTMDRLDLGYETMSERNPELIYAHSSGFGEEGQYRKYPAMDHTVQAIGGIMDVTGYPENPPVAAGPAISDFVGGIHLLSGILAALYQREHTGEGQFVEVSMHDAVYPTLTSSLSAQYRHPDVPNRTGNRHSGLAHCPYNVYETRDGYLALLCVSERHWETLVDIMGSEELAKEKYDTTVKRVEHMETVDELIEAWTREQERDEAAMRLLEAGVPCGPVKEIDEVLNDPHLEERGMVTEIDHPAYGPIRVPGLPMRLEKSEYPDIDPAPSAGQHNAEVLANHLGLSEAEIEALSDDGVI